MQKQVIVTGYLLWLLKLDINVKTSLDPLLVFYVYSTQLFFPTTSRRTLRSDARRPGAMAPRRHAT